MASLLSAPALKKTKLLFAITSPDLCNAPIDDIQRSLNDQAAAIMAKNKIPTVDLYKAITKKCGAGEHHCQRIFWLGCVLTRMALCCSAAGGVLRDEGMLVRTAPPLAVPVLLACPWNHPHPSLWFCRQLPALRRQRRRGLQLAHQQHARARHRQAAVACGPKAW